MARIRDEFVTVYFAMENTHNKPIHLPDGLREDKKMREPVSSVRNIKNCAKTKNKKQKKENRRNTRGRTFLCKRATSRPGHGEVKVGHRPQHHHHHRGHHHPSRAFCGSQRGSKVRARARAAVLLFLRRFLFQTGSV